MVYSSEIHGRSREGRQDTRNEENSKTETGKKGTCLYILFS